MSQEALYDQLSLHDALHGAVPEDFHPRKYCWGRERLSAFDLLVLQNAGARIDENESHGQYLRLTLPDGSIWEQEWGVHLHEVEPC